MNQRNSERKLGSMDRNVADLYRYRTENHIGLTEMAKVLTVETGVSFGISAMSRWELGKAVPRPAARAAIKRFLLAHKAGPYKAPTEAKPEPRDVDKELATLKSQLDMANQFNKTLRNTVRQHERRGKLYSDIVTNVIMPTNSTPAERMVALDKVLERHLPIKETEKDQNQRTLKL